MGGVNMMGGGYFYGPFISTDVFGNFVPVAGGPWVYGAWDHILPPNHNLTAKGRWLTLYAWPQAALPISVFRIQLGLGIAGSELLWQPSNMAGPTGSDGFYIDWLSPGANLWAVPYTISFPISVAPNQELSVRIADAIGGQALNVLIYIFN